MTITQAPRAKAHALSEGEFADAIGRLRRSEFMASEAQKRGTQTSVMVFGGASLTYAFGMRRGLGDIDLVIDPMPFSGILVTPYCGSEEESSRPMSQVMPERSAAFNREMQRDGFQVDMKVAYTGRSISTWRLVPRFTDLATGIHINPAGQFIWEWASGLPRQQLTVTRSIGEGEQSLEVEFMGSAMVVLTKYGASFGITGRSRGTDDMIKDFNDIRFIISNVYGSTSAFIEQERPIITRYLLAHGISQETLEDSLSKVMRLRGSGISRRQKRVEAKFQQDVATNNFGNILRR